MKTCDGPPTTPGTARRVSYMAASLARRCATAPERPTLSEVAAARQAAAEKAEKTGEPIQYYWLPEFEKLGRLAEPALVRARTVNDDAAVRAEARALLQSFKSHNQLWLQILQSQN